MGQLAVKPIQTREERNHYLQFLLNDLETLDRMISEGKLEKEKLRMGAEQELCLIDESGAPSGTGVDILAVNKDPHLTAELASFNLEINLDPVEQKSDAFRKLERQLRSQANKAESLASDFGANILMVGILPTIRLDHVQPEWMSPLTRYEILSKAVRSMRGGDFEIHIQGVDELITSLDSVLFESCNTSFQLHLQIPPEEFVRMYNWSQMIAGPVLATACNSPLLMGRELWMETRIALFQQSIDARSSSNHFSARQPRVSFGHGWIKNSITDLFKDNISRFPTVFTSDNLENAKEVYEKGGSPSLSALQLHNGTVYTWNRPCYGKGGALPHVRIENRYLPSGPTIIDEMANFAFWVGLMKGLPDEYKEFYHFVPFRTAKDNFYRAARTGLNAVMDWFGRARNIQELVLNDLIPMARKGLGQLNINQADIDRYLGVITQRVISRQTGARWQVQNFRRLSEKFKPGLAVYELTKAMRDRQRSGEPVHKWPAIDVPKNQSVSVANDGIQKIMSTDLLTVGEEESVELVRAIMKWNNIRHMPVEDTDGNLVGLITATNLMPLSKKDNHWEKMPVKDIMVRELVTVTENTMISSAINLMEQYGVGCLPVTYNGKLIGIVTDTDIKKITSGSEEIYQELKEQKVA